MTPLTLDLSSRPSKAASISEFLSHSVTIVTSPSHRAKDLDIPGLVSVYATLRLLPSNPDITRSIAITTSMLVQRSLATAKQFIEELSSAVSPSL